MTLSTITISGSDYMAYASVAEADTYLAVDPVRMAAWSALEADGKGLRLVAATRRLDALGWAGTRTSSAQLTEWPRRGLTYPGGESVDSTVIPENLENASILLAGSIALDADAASANHASHTATAGTIKSVKAGSVDIEYFSGNEGDTSSPLVLADRDAFLLIRFWLASRERSADISGMLVSGNTDRSFFSDRNPQERYSLR